MDDKQIVALYFERNESAIAETDKKYRSLCMKLSGNILSNSSDSEEVLSDAYMKLWNSIPPLNPENLGAYIAKTVRNLSLNRLKSENAQKRGSAEKRLSFDELDECTPAFISTEDSVQMSLLSKSISDFLYTQKSVARNIFVRRYFYCDSIDDIAKSFGFSESKVKSTLMRTRNKLKEHLEKEGYNCE